MVITTNSGTPFPQSLRHQTQRVLQGRIETQRLHSLRHGTNHIRAISQFGRIKCRQMFHRTRLASMRLARGDNGNASSATRWRYWKSHRSDRDAMSKLGPRFSRCPNVRPERSRSVILNAFSNNTPPHRDPPIKHPVNRVTRSLVRQFLFPAPQPGKRVQGRIFSRPNKLEFDGSFSVRRG